MSGVWDPLRPSLDRDPPIDPPLPDASYVVCATPRTGSGLLCRGLASTGLAGIPAEYFNVNQREPLTRRWECGADPMEYARALRAYRTGPDGCFGSKLHWSQLMELSRETSQPGSGRSLGSSPGVIEELLPGSLLVHILRLDIDAQAVSLWVANWTGVWSQPNQGPEPRAPRVPYSYTGIERCRQEIVDGEIGWQRFFALSAIKPYVVIYEQLVENYSRQIQATLKHIRPDVEAPDVPAPTSRRQGGEMSNRLVERFAEERARRARTGPPKMMSALRRTAAFVTPKR